MQTIMLEKDGKQVEFLVEKCQCCGHERPTAEVVRAEPDTLARLAELRRLVEISYADTSLRDMMWFAPVLPIAFVSLLFPQLSWQGFVFLGTAFCVMIFAAWRTVKKNERKREQRWLYEAEQSAILREFGITQRGYVPLLTTASDHSHLEKVLLAS